MARPRTSGANALNVLTDDELGSAAQRDRRKRILDATIALASKGGFEAVQMRAVAEKADVALGTLYRYFPSKEQLYAHVLLEWSESFEPRVRSERAGQASDGERLRAALRRAVRAYERHPHFYRLITVLEVVTDPVVTDLYATFASRFSGALRDTLTDVDDEDAAAIAMMAAAVLGSLLRSWALGKSPIARVYADLDRMVDLVFAGPARRTAPG
jgi:TetR/AcrR family transcriptional regulator, cholesterol catabolism regulator